MLLPILQFLRDIDRIDTWELLLEMTEFCWDVSDALEDVVDGFQPM